MAICKWGQQDIYCTVECFIWTEEVWSMDKDINDVTKYPEKVLLSMGATVKFMY